MGLTDIKVFAAYCSPLYSSPESCIFKNIQQYPQIKINKYKEQLIKRL